MAYNIPTTYKDQNPAPQLSKSVLNKMVWRSLFLQGSFNYERMQAAGWLYGILPGLEKIHTNKDDLAASMAHNLEFFNTHPFLVTFVMGIVLSLEQNKADIPTIRAVRVAAMGPLGGIGDALFWFTLVPITAGITSNMALGGSIAAPFLFLLIFNVAQFAVRYGLMHWSYKTGTSAISILTQNAKEFTRAASILGVFIVGALTVLYGGTKVAYEVPNGKTNVAVTHTLVVKDAEVAQFNKLLYKPDAKDTTKDDLLPGAGIVDLGNGYKQLTVVRNEEQPVKIKIQSILDGILPNLVDLGLVMLLYLLITKRRWTPLLCIGLLLVIAIAGSYIGLF